MRKIIYSVALAAIAAFAATSCVKEDFSSGNAGGEVEFTVSASLPGAVSTYGSEQGGINNVDNNSYKLRYILEVYTDEATPRLAYKSAKYADSFTTPVSFSARLLALDYNFVFWADFIPNDKAGTDESSIRTNDYIYATNDEQQGLRAITIAADRAAGTDVADAYYCVEEMDLTGGSVSKKDIRLRRPFGKIRLVATDTWAGELQANGPSKAEVKYSADLMVPSGFNALAKTALDESILAAGYEYEVLGRETVSVKDDDVEAYILGIDYIFASQDRNVFNFDVVTRDASGAQIGYREISNVPVAENKLTTVMGNFFTNEGTIEVVVDDEFEEEDIVGLNDGVYNDTTGEYYESLQDAISAANDNDVIRLTAGDHDGITTNAAFGSKHLVIVGDEGARIKGVNLNAGSFEFENIEFYGTSTYQGKGSTVFVAAQASFTDCVFNGTESVRLMETAYGSKFDLVIDGCTFRANGIANHPYVNPFSTGSLTLTDNTFEDVSISVEITQNGNEYNYPVVTGNAFTTFSTSDYASSAAELKLLTREFFNALLVENTFSGTNKISVSKQPWDGSKFYVNDVLGFSGAVFYSNDLRNNSGDWDKRSGTEPVISGDGLTIYSDAFSKYNTLGLPVRYYGDWTQSIDIYLDPQNWEVGEYFYLVSAANNLGGNHAGLDQGLAMLRTADKVCISLTTNSSGVDGEGVYDDVPGKRTSKKIDAAAFAADWYTLSGHYVRESKFAYKVEMSLLDADGAAVLSHTFTMTGQDLAFARYIFLTTAEKTPHSNPADARPIKVRNQKLVID